MQITLIQCTELILVYLKTLHQFMDMKAKAKHIAKISGCTLAGCF